MIEATAKIYCFLSISVLGTVKMSDHFISMKTPRLSIMIITFYRY